MEIKKEDLEKITSYHKKLFGEIIAECNGKVMDYQSCKMIEQAFEISLNQLVEGFMESINLAKRIKQLEKGENNDN